MDMDDELFCYGCAHSVDDLRSPGEPSGADPCRVCIRNPDIIDDFSPLDNVFLNRMFIVFPPEDMYISQARFNLEMKGFSASFDISSNKRRFYRNPTMN